MSRMSDLDLMVREGERTAEDFIARGVDARTARAMADVVSASNLPDPEPEGSDMGGFDVNGDASWGIGESPDPEPEGAFGHGPGCWGECDGEYDCNA